MNLKEQEKRIKQLENLEARLKSIQDLEAKGYKSAISRKQTEDEILDIKEKVWKGSAQFASNEVSLGKKIEKLQSSAFNTLNKKLGLEKSLKSIKHAQLHGDKQQQKEAKAYADLLEGVNNGSKDLEDVLNAIADDSLGAMNVEAEKLVEVLESAPDLSKKLEVEADAQQKIDDFKKKISETSALLSSPKAMGVAAIGMAVKLMSDFAEKALDVRQSLGTTAMESSRVAGNMMIAGASAKVVGGNVQEAEAAVKSLAEEFGSTSFITAGISKQLGLVTGQFALSGANAGKLLKSMQSISGASMETNLNLISSAGELARAEGVAPGKVLNDIASDTETFAKFGQDGGKNLIKAGIAAAKLGMSMSEIAGIASNLLDFESSIEKSMEASMLLGRQVNLDKARELALTGDLAGLTEEVKKQVGSQAEFEAMNVVQRQALADAIGTSVADLGKMVAGEQTSAQIAEKNAAQQKQNLQTQKLLAYVTAGGAVAQIFASLAKVPFGLGLLAAGGIAAGMYGMMRSAPKMQTGGTVRETGMAVVHKGETVSGTAGQFGGETNKLLRQLIVQQEKLHNRLSNKVGDLALS